jgi:hypothetical protein
MTVVLSEQDYQNLLKALMERDEEILRLKASNQNTLAKLKFAEQSLSAVNDNCLALTEALNRLRHDVDQQLIRQEWQGQGQGIGAHAPTRTENDLSNRSSSQQHTARVRDDVQSLYERFPFLSRRGFFPSLGLEVEDISQQSTGKVRGGVRVLSAAPPAASTPAGGGVGVRRGDTIERITVEKDYWIRSLSDYCLCLAELPPDSQVTLHTLRSGSCNIVRLTPTILPPAPLSQ